MKAHAAAVIYIVPHFVVVVVVVVVFCCLSSAICVAAYIILLMTYCTLLDQFLRGWQYTVISNTIQNAYCMNDHSDVEYIVFV